jgi:hypothetical protein
MATDAINRQCNQRITLPNQGLVLTAASARPFRSCRQGGSVSTGPTFCKKDDMADTKTGYRAFPPEITHPSSAICLSQEEFDRIEKQRLEEAPSACPGHLGTVVWYAKSKGYIIQVKLDGKQDVFATSICTFTPTMGMDQIDGMFAQDVEESILNRELGCPTNRLDVFQDREAIPVEQYLRSRGAIK